MKYRTEKARELKNELDAIQNKRKAEEQRCNQLFYRYCDMEGMHGRKAHDPWDDGMGMRGYHYEYATEELRLQEIAEREQFLKDNNYKSHTEIYEEYQEQENKLNEAFHLEQYGMTVAKKNLADLIKRQTRYVEKVRKDLAHQEKLLQEYFEEFEKTS